MLTITDFVCIFWWCLRLSQLVGTFGTITLWGSLLVPMPLKISCMTSRSELPSWPEYRDACLVECTVLLFLGLRRTLRRPSKFCCRVCATLVWIRVAGRMSIHLCMLAVILSFFALEWHTFDVVRIVDVKNAYTFHTLIGNAWEHAWLVAANKSFRFDCQHKHFVCVCIVCCLCWYWYGVSCCCVAFYSKCWLVGLASVWLLVRWFYAILFLFHVAHLSCVLYATCFQIAAESNPGHPRRYPASAAVINGVSGCEPRLAWQYFTSCSLLSHL